MAGRRRKGNPLLVRIILISIGVHIVVLPILAYFGAFKKVSFLGLTPEVVILPPPPKDQTRPEVKKQAQKAVHKAAGKGSLAKRSGPKTNYTHPPVVAARGPADSTGTGSTIDTNGSGAVGLPPKVVAANKPSGGGNGNEAGANPAPQPTTHTAPAESIPAATPVATPKPAPHAPVLTEVSPTYNPSPVIPDDLRSDAMDATVTAQFMVSPSGAPTDVRIVKSSGNEQLDSLALESARKWRFKPATRDGEPIESRVILHIEFEVQ